MTIIQTPIISVVMGVYNQKDVIKKVIQAYDEQEFAKDQFELIIVDSESTDGTTALLKKIKTTFSLKHIIQKNNGKAAARNAGVKQAQSEIIVITDADLIPDQQFLHFHYKAHKRHVGPACFQGLEYNMKKLNWPPTKKDLSPILPRRYPNHKKLGFYYFLTGNISFPKYLFEQEKGFNEEFKGYGWEDLELGYRFEKRGVPLYYLKKAINYHYHIVSKESDILRCFEKGKSAQIFLKKHPELKLFLGLNPVSSWLHSKIKENGLIYKIIESYFYQSKIRIIDKFGTWFLKEYAYLTGLKSK